MNKIKILYYSLPSIIFKFIRLISYRFYNPIIYDFIFSPIGSKYGLDKKDRLKLIKKFINIIANVKSATSLETHLVLAKYLLSLSKSNNVVVECGCYKGASSCSMSLICKIIGKRLIIYDSFAGLPEVIVKNNIHYLHLKKKENYKKGMYKGNLEEVKNNIKKFGDMSVCVFRKGFFEKTLPHHSEKIELAFFDVDLKSSTKNCIKFLWKKIIDNGYVFTDDSCDLDNVKVWFDDSWWKKIIGTRSPGYVGSGCGLPLNQSHSGLGYTIKNPNLKSFTKKNKFSINL